LLLLPLLLFLASQKLDKIFDFSQILLFPFNICLGAPLFVGGLFFSAWAVWAQFKIGQGTPAPIMPAQKLVIKAPYTYCRNPMGLGFGLWLIGFGVVFNSFSFTLISVFLSVLLLLYYKFIEEEELAVKFGQEYLEYKKRTSFLMPTFRRKKS